MSRNTVDDWRREVFRARHITERTRVLLLALADDMGADLKVSVSRKALAKKLGLSERRLGDRFREAVGEMLEPDPEKARLYRQHRLLDRVVRGQRHAQAVYQGLVAEPLNMTPCRPIENRSQQDGLKRVENPQNRPVENPAVSVNPDVQQDTRGSCLIGADLLVSPTDRNDGSNEENEGAVAASRLTACEAHGWTECPDRDCIDAEARRHAS